MKSRDRRHYSGGKQLGGPDPQLAGGGIRQKVDVRNALAQFIEDDSAPLDEGVTIGRRFNPLSRAVEETHAERMFEVGDRLRDGGLRHVEAADRLAHAACGDHGHQDVEVPQLDAASQTFIPWHAG